MPYKDPAAAAAHRREYQHVHRAHINEQHIAWCKANTKRIKEYNAKYYRNLQLHAPETIRKYGLRQDYNLSLDDYYTLLTSQNNLCAICHNPLTNPHVDHNHITGQIRGLLCRLCNNGIGFLKDDPTILLAAIHYLQFHGDTTIGTLDAPGN